MDFTDFQIVAENQETNVICVRLGFMEDSLVIIEPEQWPEDVSVFVATHIQQTMNPDPSSNPQPEAKEADPL